MDDAEDVADIVVSSADASNVGGGLPGVTTLDEASGATLGTDCPVDASTSLRLTPKLTTLLLTTLGTRAAVLLATRFAVRVEDKI